MASARCWRYDDAGMRGVARALLPIVLAAPVSWSVPAAGEEAAAVSAEDKASAAKKFRAAEAAFRRHQYAAAAEGFEEANSIAPHPAALFNAARAWEKAGELTRAANLCARYLQDAPEDDPRRTKANELIAELLPKLGRIEVVDKGAKNVQVDGKPRELDITYVDPGDHGVSGVFGDRVVRRKISVVAGSLARVVLDRPKPKPEIAEPEPSLDEPSPDRDRKAAEDGKPLSPTWVFVGAGATAVLAGVTVWSGLDTQAARRDFDDHPTQGGLDDGRAKQSRTNVLLGATLVVGAATGAIALFATDWRGQPEPAEDLAIGIGPSRIELSGRF